MALFYKTKKIQRDPPIAIRLIVNEVDPNKKLNKYGRIASVKLKSNNIISSPIPLCNDRWFVVFKNENKDLMTLDDVLHNVRASCFLTFRFNFLKDNILYMNRSNKQKN